MKKTGKDMKRRRERVVKPFSSRRVKEANLALYIRLVITT
jgi:hypothetical protein